MKIAFLLLTGVTLFQNCQHYMVKETSKYELNDRELNIFRKKKFALIGFYPFHFSLQSQRIFETEEPKFPCSYYDSLKEIDRDLAVYHCIVEYLNDGNKNNSPNLYKKLHMRIPGTRYESSYTIPATLNYSTTTSIYFPARNEIKRIKDNINHKEISEENLKSFLITYLKTVRHSGLKEIESILDIEYSYEDCDCNNEKKKIRKIKSIKLKNINADYWIITEHRELFHGIFDRGSNSQKPSLKGLTFIPAILSFGIIPYWDEAAIESKFKIFDENLNLVNILTYQSEYDHLTGIWFLSSKKIIQFARDPNRQNTEPVLFYESSIKKFAKDIYLFHSFD